MQTIPLPPTAMAHYILEKKIPMALVQLPATAAANCYTGGLCYATDAEPARTVPVILSLYHAGAYPARYYKHKPELAVEPGIRFEPQA